MASNQTANLGLSQWEADDEVLRADFNSDNAKIDAAIMALRQKAASLEESQVLLLDKTITAQTGLWQISLRGLDFSPFRALRAYVQLTANAPSTVYVYFNDSLRTKSVMRTDDSVSGGLIDRHADLSVFGGEYYNAPVSCHRLDFDLRMPLVNCFCLSMASWQPTGSTVSNPCKSWISMAMDRTLIWEQVTELDLKCYDASAKLQPGSRLSLYGVR